MLVLSHRGYHETAPENTVEAFALAEQMGVDGIETDLRVTSDGALVLFHDRVVADGREIADLTHQQLIDAVRYPVPTAEQAIAGFDNLLWNLEIKVPEALGPALELVRMYATSRRRFLLTSFWHNVVAECAQMIANDAALSTMKNIECGLLTADRPINLASFLGNVPVSSVSVVVWYYDILDPPLLESARQQGLANYVYGVRTLDDHRRCLQLGLQGVITDHPQLMAQARLAHEGN